jgi:hypothetical protein
LQKKKKIHTLTLQPSQKLNQNGSQGWGCSSVAEYMVSMKVLISILSAKKKTKRGVSRGGKDHRTKTMKILKDDNNPFDTTKGMIHQRNN